MEIRRKFNKTVYFGELPQGKCFSLNSEPDNTYMKTTDGNVSLFTYLD